MRKTYSVLLILLLCILSWKVGRAQSSPQPFTIVSVSATHLMCPPVTANTTMYCFAFDGIWQSLSGAAYTQVGAVASGVTSVNGKTGAVVIGATTTATTTLQ